MAHTTQTTESRGSRVSLRTLATDLDSLETGAFAPIPETILIQESTGDYSFASPSSGKKIFGIWKILALIFILVLGGVGYYFFLR